MVRPRAGVGLRVQPRGGDPLLRARGRARPRAGRSRAGASPTRSVPTTTRRWDAFDPIDLATRWRGPRELGLAAPGRASALERGLIDAPCRPGIRPMSRRSMPGGTRRTPTRWPRWREAFPDDLDVVSAHRRRPAQPHRVGAVGHHDRRTGAGFAGRARPSALLDGALATPVGADHPGVAAPVPARAGDVGAPRGRRCPRPTGCAAWCPTPATCCTCPATSTCSAATTQSSIARTRRRWRPTASSSSARDR